MKAKFVKIVRSGERFWSKVVSSDDNGMTLKCANDLSGANAPQFGETFHVGPDEEILDVAYFDDFPHNAAESTQ